MAKDQKRNSGSDLPSGDSPTTLPAPGHPLSTKDSGRFLKADAFFQRACARADEFTKSIAEQLQQNHPDVQGLKTETAFQDYVNIAFFQFRRSCQTELFSNIYPKFVDQVDKEFQSKLDAAMKSLRAPFYKMIYAPFLNEINAFTKEIARQFVTNDPALAEARKTKDAFLKNFDLGVVHIQQASSIPQNLPKDIFDTQFTDDLKNVIVIAQLKLAEGFIKGSFEKSVFESSEGESLKAGRVNPPTDLHMRVRDDYQLEGLAPQPVISDEMLETMRKSAARQYVSMVRSMKAQEMQQTLQDAYESNTQLKDLFSDYKLFIFGVGAELAHDQQMEIDSDRDVAIAHNEQIDLGKLLAEGRGTMYDELSETLGGNHWSAWSESLGGNEWDAWARELDKKYDFDLVEATCHNDQLDLGAEMAHGLGTMYDELSERLTIEHLDSWSTELETEFGQTWDEHYHDEWAADLSAAAKTPQTKSLLERVEESQKYTNLSKEEYQRVKDTIVTNILPDAKMISALPATEVVTRWDKITQGLRAKLMEYVSRGEYSEGEFQEFLEDEVRTLEGIIVTSAVSELPVPTQPGVASEVRMVDALFDEDFEDPEYEPNPAQTPVIPTIDDSSVATIPQALYSPPVKVDNSQSSDEKGAEATITRETPMTPQKEESQNTSTISNLYRLVEDRLTIKKNEWADMLSENTFSEKREPEVLLETEMALFISNVVHADGTTLTQGMSALPTDQQKDLYHALVTYGVEFMLNRSKAQAKSTIETKLTPEDTSVPSMLLPAVPDKKNSVPPAKGYSRIDGCIVAGLFAAAITAVALYKGCSAPKNEKKLPVEAKVEIKVEPASRGTLESYLSSFYLNDVETAHKMWPQVEAQFPNPGVSNDVQPVYAQFAAELKTAKTPKDALMTFRSYRSFLQQDLNNGSLTKDQFDASLGQALRDLNMGEYK